MKKFVIYIRLSKEDKKRTQHGFDSQTADIQYYLDSLEEEYVVIRKVEEFISGAAECRPEMDSALKLCEESGATLLVAKLDRLSRKVSVISTLMERTKVTFKVATMPQADNFQLHIYAALAEQERASIADRVRRGMAAAKAKGVKIGAASEVYKCNPDNLNAKRNTQAKGKAEAYRTTFKSIIAAMPKPTYQSMATALTKADISLPSGVVGEWKSSQVKRVVERLELSIY